MAARDIGALQRAVLRAPAPVARPLACLTGDAEQRWMLSQPRAVRESFLRDVIDGPPIARLDEFWMLRQSNEVRQSYVRQVLNSHEEG
jgi:hypothetical protein